MAKIINITLLAVAASISAFAAVPEIDPASSVSAIALLSGAVLVLRSRRRK